MIQMVFYPFEFLWRSILRLFQPPAHHTWIEAEYDNGLMLDVIDGTVRNIDWSCRVAKTGHCPLTVSLDDGTEIDESTLQSADAMRALGAKMHGGEKSNEGEEMSFAEFRTREYFVVATYVKDALDYVELHILPQAKGSLKVGVDGRTFELPISQESLFEILGPPDRQE